MSVKVRLTRTGANRDISFRVVAADTRFPRDGRFIENLGWYSPRRPGKNYELKLDRIAYWQSVGAITSLLGAPFFLAIIFGRKGEHD